MAVTVRTSSPVLDVAKMRGDVPVLSRKVNGKPVAYLDNAATSQKPRQVIDAMRAVFEDHNANIHRGVYEFSEITTAEFEGAREKVARFINAASSREIVFVRNATEGVNLVAYTWGREHIKAGDEIVSTVLEHHSNFVPWQQLAKYGGDMIARVTVAETTWNELPWKFEAGTSSYVDAIGLGAAVDYLEAVGMDKIHAHELYLTGYLLPRLQEIPGVTVYGPKTLEDR